MTKKFESSKNFKLIKDGKLNINYPRGYNLATGRIDVKECNTKEQIFLPDYRELKD